MNTPPPSRTVWATLLIKCRVTAGHQPILAPAAVAATTRPLTAQPPAQPPQYTKCSRRFILEPGSGRRRPHHDDNIRSIHTHTHTHLLEPPSPPSHTVYMYVYTLYIIYTSPLHSHTLAVSLHCIISVCAYMRAYMHILYAMYTHTHTHALRTRKLTQRDMT